MKRHLRFAFLLIGSLFVFLLTNAVAQRKFSGADRSRSASFPQNYISNGYFPMEVGNEWIYSDGDNSITVQVLRETKEANGRKYFEISGYFPEDPAEVRKIRSDPYGMIVEYNPNGDDFLWYRFGAFNSVMTFETNGDIPCITGSLVTSGGIRETIVAPAGTFENTLRISYQSPCIDAGLLTENFAYGTGLVQRVVETIAGPRTYKLSFARVGSREIPLALHGVQVSMDRPIYHNNLMPPIISNPWPRARVMLVVRNTTETPVDFTFPTSQRFDFIVRNALGNEVLRWSDGRIFLPMAKKETLVNDLWCFPAELALKGRNGDVLPPGFYTLTGYLTLQNDVSGISSMSGTVTFEIQNTY